MTCPHLLHHLVLFVEELHLDVSADRKRLWELKNHQFVFPPGVSRVRSVDLHLQLVNHKLRVCIKNTTVFTCTTYRLHYSESGCEQNLHTVRETYCRCLQ